jgi:hypothetical protein
MYSRFFLQDTYKPRKIGEIEEDLFENFEGMGSSHARNE